MSSEERLVAQLLELDRQHPDADVMPFKEAADTITRLTRELATARAGAYDDAAGIAREYEAKPLGPATGWSEDEAEGFENGCLDTASAIATAIQARKDQT